MVIKGPEIFRECSPPSILHRSHVTCHVSHVTCHVSHVTFYMSCVINPVLHVICNNLMHLFGEGLLSMGPNPSSLIYMCVF